MINIFSKLPPIPQTKNIDTDIFQVFKNPQEQNIDFQAPKGVYLNLVQSNSDKDTIHINIISVNPKLQNQ
jgi:hypothetical protein